jgi:hypothetical protein
MWRRARAAATIRPIVQESRLACRGHGLRGESLGLGDKCGCQSGEEDVEAAFEFGGAVVGGQDWGEAA